MCRRRGLAGGTGLTAGTGLAGVGGGFARTGEVAGGVGVAGVAARPGPGGDTTRPARDVEGRRRRGERNRDRRDTRTAVNKSIVRPTHQ